MQFIFSDISVTAAATHSTTRPGLYFITLTCPPPSGSFLSGCTAVSPVSGISVREICKKMGASTGESTSLTWNHVQTFAFLHNMRKQDDYSKFTKIISVLYIATKFYIKSDSVFFMR